MMEIMGDSDYKRGRIRAKISPNGIIKSGSY